MNLKQAIELAEPQQLLQRAESICAEAGIEWTRFAMPVFRTIVSHPELSPGTVKLAKQRVFSSNNDTDELIAKWLLKLKNGYESRPSRRTSNMPGTVPDPILEKMIKERLGKLEDKHLPYITYAHRLAMSAENILGALLEEFLSNRLDSLDWFCAWGETVKSVDFVSGSGQLLQIKNRSNSENSSSARVRDGTEIMKWYRIEAARIEYNWQELNELIVGLDADETAFSAFVRRTIEANPGCLAVEPDNPWGNIS